jgi:hypothetical protein
MSKAPSRPAAKPAQKEITVSVGALRAPDSIGFIDHIGIRDEGLHLVFEFVDTLQSREGASRARIAVSIDAVLTGIWDNSKDVFQRASSLLAACGFSSVAPSDHLTWSAEIPTVPASLFRVGHHGAEAEIQVFHLSPYQVFQAKIGDAKLQVEPLFRVSLPLAVFVGMYEFLSGQVEDYRRRVDPLGGDVQ